MLVTIIELVVTTLVRWVADRYLEKKVPLVRCVIKGCGQPVTFKGLCRECYKQAKKLVTARTTTWEQLGRKGLAVVEVSKFLEAYEKQREKDAKSGKSRRETEEE